MRPDDLSLLLAEWQGYGLDASVAPGRGRSPRSSPPGAFVEVEAPDNEALAVEDGVLGLSSIAARASRPRWTPSASASRRASSRSAAPAASSSRPSPYLNDRYRGDLAVIWLDAHGDLNTPQTSPSGRFHGMVLRTLLGAGPRVALVSLLPRTARAAADRARRHRAISIATRPHSSATPRCRCFSPADLLVPDRIAGRIRAAGFTKIYVHLDLDVIDPVEFPDSLVHAPDGVSMDVRAETVRDLAATFDVVGFSVGRVPPALGGCSHPRAQLLDRCGIELGCWSIRSRCVTRLAQAAAGLVAARCGRAPAARAICRAPTFNKDIAPIVFANCASCHRPGGAAPFSLLTYADVRRTCRRRRASDTRRAHMPPWLPERGEFPIVGERRLARRTDRRHSALGEGRPRRRRGRGSAAGAGVSRRLGAGQARRGAHRRRSRTR